VAAVLAVGLGLPGVWGLAQLAPAAAQTPGLEWHIEIPEAAGPCTTAGDAKGTCELALGAAFTLEVYLDDISGIGNASYDSGVTSAGHSDPGPDTKIIFDIIWPDCGLVVPFVPPEKNYGCSIGLPPATSSTYTGLFMTWDFNCDESGAVYLIHGPADTLVIDSKGSTHFEAGPDVLNVECLPVTLTPTVTPTPTPTRTPTPPPFIGGISRSTDSATQPASAERDDGGFGWARPGAAAGLGVILVAAAWYAERRWFWRSVAPARSIKR
jgi:hypothetical protein